MSWSALLSQTQIQKLKDNTKPFGLCEPWMQNVFGDIEAFEDLEIFLSDCGWTTATVGQEKLRHCTYRLNPEWSFPTKEGESEYEYRVPLIDKDGLWRVEMPERGYGTCLLSDISSHPRFCGIEYKESLRDFWAKTGLMVDDENEVVSYVTQSEQARPATPVRVRFLKEKK